MTNQDIVNRVDDALPGSKELAPDVKEKILNAVWNTLSDHRADPVED